MSDSSSSRFTSPAPSAVAGVVGGDLLGGRYRIRRVLARGGMATVYQALDEELDREVAVKIPHVGTDPVFLDRFRREAVTAANIHHENVVSIFDSRRDGDLVYLVMEFVDGVSLGDVLRRRPTLSPAEVAGVLVPAAAGIGAAHARGFVHRDVKPENLLISAEGHVKVTDFGLARAIAVTKATFGPGALAGSAHYLSPEAARDEPLHAPADVYALGIVLFESLTGWPPFEAETAVATALRHTTDRVPPLADVVDVPPALDEVVCIATAPEAADRYPDAAAFAAALSAAVPERTVPQVERRPPSQTLIVPRDHADTIVPAPGQPPPGTRQRRRRRDTSHDAAAARPYDVDHGDGPPTASAGPDVYTAPAATSDEPVARQDEEAANPPADDDGIFGTADREGDGTHGAPDAPDVGEPDDPHATVAVDDGPADRTLNENPGPATDDTGSASAPQDPDDTDDPDDPDEDAHRPRRRWPRRLLVASVLLLVVAGGAALAWATLVAPIEDIPNVTGMDENAAVAALEDAGFEVDVGDDERFSTDVPRGDVLAQNPTGTGRVGSTVQLEVSAGPPPVEGGVPNVVDRDAEAALERLRDAGLEPAVQRRHHEEIAAGSVVSTDPPAGDDVLVGDAVTVVVSDGPAPIDVPGVVGAAEDVALAAIKEAGLAGTVVNRVYDEQVPAGVVLDQNPGEGQVRHRGDAVELTVSRGPEPFEVPNVIGEARAPAVEQLKGMGLEVVVEDVDAAGAERPGTVAEQEPAPGSTVRRGDRVRLYVWK